MLKPAHPAAIWQAGHPLWLCPFRPFFALVLLMGPMLMCLWLLFLGMGWPLPQVPGGPLVWHAHELLFGFSLAAVAGFVLTAVPEFTETPAFRLRPIRQLVGWWLLGRLAFWFSGWWEQPALLLAALAHLCFMAQLLWLVAPRLWQFQDGRHQGFLWGLLALAAVVAGFYADLLRADFPMRWLHAALGVLMILVVVSMSRISMAIVNDSIDEQAGRQLPDPAPEDAEAPAAYLARPPRRHLAVFCISLFSLMDWLDPGSRISGWLALASSAAMLNLLNDWHVGRAIWRRWPLMLYIVYVMMALGYALAGFSVLAGTGSASGGLHLLAIGALGLGVYVVICIAGYTHSGLDKDGRNWVPAGAILLVLAAILRVMADRTAVDGVLTLAGLLFCMAFLLQAVAMLPVFLRPRADGASGCEGRQPLAEDPASRPA